MRYSEQVITRITPELRAQIKAKCEQEGRSESDIVRRILERALKPRRAAA